MLSVLVKEALHKVTAVLELKEEDEKNGVKRWRVKKESEKEQPEKQPPSNRFYIVTIHKPEKFGLPTGGTSAEQYNYDIYNSALRPESTNFLAAARNEVAAFWRHHAEK